jgi:hypothetical protein
MYEDARTYKPKSLELTFFILNISDGNLQLYKFLLNTVMGFGADRTKVAREIVRI